MKSIRILSARYDEQYDHIEVVKEITNDDDSTELNLHTFDRELLEWRAATYDITDLNELVDIVLYEPYIEAFDPIADNREEATIKCKDRISRAKSRLRRPDPKPNKIETKNLMQANNIPEKYLAAVDDDPYEVIIANSLIHPSSIRIIRMYIEGERQKYKAETQLPRTEDGEERAKRLEDKLILRKRSDVNPPSPAIKKNELPTIIMEGRKRK